MAFPETPHALDFGPPPSVGLDWYLAHGLGNDYLVTRGDAAWGPYDDVSRWIASPEAIRRVCHRTSGVGADGLIVVTTRDEPFELRGFNPDGSGFERSGNGLRIVASFLHRIGWIEHDPFRVEIGGDPITLQVHAIDADAGHFDVSVEMGRATLAVGEWGRGLRDLPEDLVALEAVPVTVGNPHLVVWAADAQIDEVGPVLSGSALFPDGVNLQVVRDLDDHGMAIEIWERGVGRTSASGTSACAVAVSAVATERLAPGPIEVRMPGGTLHVTVGPDLDVTLRGPVQAVAEGRLDPGFARSLAGSGAGG
ncbi:MAG: diaminopimelate epimerase [Longimicrobiales bacterium]|nr:diaminopimelate epimerase [Longimicrobiales bacterium]